MAIEQRVGSPLRVEPGSRFEHKSTHEAFLQLSSELALEKWEDSSLHGTYNVTCERSELPDELGNVVDILGVKGDVGLIVRANKWVSNEGRNSVNQIIVRILGHGVCVVYNYDNGRRILEKYGFKGSVASK